MRIFQSLLKIPATILWNLSEWSGIGLGRFAPTVFGWMIGSKPVIAPSDSQPNSRRSGG
jgi:hypothetical protein